MPCTMYGDMYTRRIALALLAAALLRAQNTEPSFQIVGAVKQPLTLTAADLGRMPRATVRTNAKGVETVYEGVWLHELLSKAGVPQASEMRGNALTSYVLASAHDGYQALFALVEFDPAFQDSQVLIADTINGKPLTEPQDRFRLVAPMDKRPSRSVRQLAKLEVVSLAK